MIERIPSPPAWPAHDPDHWARLARSAASALEQLRDDGGRIRRDSDQTSADPKDLRTTALVCESLINLVDSRSSWATRDVRKAILELVSILTVASVAKSEVHAIGELSAHAAALVRAHMIDRKQFELGREVDTKLADRADKARARLLEAVLPNLLDALATDNDGAPVVPVGDVSG